jgi:galactokinase
MNRIIRPDSVSPEVAEMVGRLKQEFYSRFPGESAITGSWGACRIEGFGNHTDYNQLYTLSNTIPYGVAMIARKRDDNLVRIHSLNTENSVRFRTGTADEIMVQKQPKGSEEFWGNYLQGVLWSMTKSGFPVTGFDAVIQGNAGLGSGVSTSAAIEAACAYSLMGLTNTSIKPMKLIELCKRAENEYVGAGCGYLDQATSLLADGVGLFIDYMPKDGQPFAYEEAPMNLGEHCFVVGYDPNSKHELVDGKYDVRRLGCELVASAANNVQKRDIRSLRDIGPKEYDAFNYLFEEEIRRILKTEQGAQLLALGGWNDEGVDKAVSVLYYRAQHPISEGMRVLAVRPLLQQGRIMEVGTHMLASGRSAVINYQLDEGSRELTWVLSWVPKNFAVTNVTGIRNMGGGFNATTLALVRQDFVPEYQARLSDAYQRRFNQNYLFLVASPAPASALLDLQ